MPRPPGELFVGDRHHGLRTNTRPWGLRSGRYQTWWRTGRDSNSRTELPRLRHFQCRALMLKGSNTRLHKFSSYLPTENSKTDANDRLVLAKWFSRPAALRSPAFSVVRQRSPLYMSGSPFVRQRSATFAKVRRGCRHGCRQPPLQRTRNSVASTTIVGSSSRRVVSLDYLPVPAVLACDQAAKVVDLAGVVDVVLEKHR